MSFTVLTFDTKRYNITCDHMCRKMCTYMSKELDSWVKIVIKNIYKNLSFKKSSETNIGFDFILLMVVVICEIYTYYLQVLFIYFLD